MLIFEITDKTSSLSDIFSQESGNMATDGFAWRKIMPSRLTFLTSMRIATELKHHSPDAIIAYTIADAQGAVSARKLQTGDSSRKTTRILLYALHADKLPKSINKDVASNIDAILYDCPETKEKWSKTRNINKILNQKTVPYPVAAPKVAAANAANNDADIQPNKKPCLGHVGPINDGKSLKKLMERLIGTDCDGFDIVVAGTAQAGTVMPIVKLARANKIPVEWLGNDYDSETLQRRLTAFYPSGQALSDTEKVLLSKGIPALDPDKKIEKDELMPSYLKSGQAVETFEKTYRPQIFQENLNSILP